MCEVQEVVKSMFFSGGAAGADRAWSDLITSKGFSMIVMSFKGHRGSFNKNDTIVQLSDEQLAEAKPWIAKAAKSRNQTPSSSPYVFRDWFIVKNADAIVAIGKMNGGFVEGGTGWTWQMYLEKDPVMLAWIFDQNSNRWFAWFGGSGSGWVNAPHGPPPLRSLGRVALIGSRDLTPEGLKALQSVIV